MRQPQLSASEADTTAWDGHIPSITSGKRSSENSKEIGELQEYYNIWDKDLEVLEEKVKKLDVSDT